MTLLKCFIYTVFHSVHIYILAYFLTLHNPCGDHAQFRRSYCSLLAVSLFILIRRSQQNVISNSAGSISSDTAINIETALESMRAGMEDMSIPDLILMMLQTSIVQFAMKIMSVLITVILFGRMIEIFIYCSISPIPFATMTNREWGGMGTNYLKGLFAVAFQGFFIMVCVGIYAVLVNEIVLSDDPNMALLSIVAYTVLLCYSLFKTGSLSRSIFGSH
jgi:hypothetical protein